MTPELVLNNGVRCPPWASACSRVPRRRPWLPCRHRVIPRRDSGVLVNAGVSQAATSQPCDIYASGGTPCVAAHSTTRALYAAYTGSLYQVKRASDSATRNITPLSAGGVANAAAQDTFCAGTTCLITIIYDQSGHGNNLTQAPPGGFNGPDVNGYDNLAGAAAAPVTVGGH